jgi:protein gp37
MGEDIWGPGKPRKTWPHDSKHWNEPLNWHYAAMDKGEMSRVFCGSMCDWAEEEMPKAELKFLWKTIPKCYYLQWLLLTKRADRIGDCLPSDWHKEWDDKYRHVWLGTSIENKDYIWRANELKKIPAMVHFISAEPLLGSLKTMDLRHIEWVIVGAESGHEFRQMNPQWARELRDKCLKIDTAYFYKQSSGLFPGTDPVLDGVEWHEFPLDRNNKKPGYLNRKEISVMHT